MKANEAQGNPLPPFSDAERRTLDYAIEVVYNALLNPTYEQVRWLSTPFVSQLLENTQNRDLKFKLYSAHDSNI